MVKAKEDAEREQRIRMEIVVDAYDEVERAMGWYYYLEGQLMFPFTAKCIAKRDISPLKKGETVPVEGMASEDDCMHKMFVKIRWQKRKLAVPLSQLKAVEVDDETQQAIEDWHYWTARGYQF